MVDVDSQLGAVSRGFRIEERDGVRSHVQTLEQTYRSPIEDVWSAVTTGDRIARWFLPISGDLRLGGRYQFEGNAGGEVLECTPPADGAAGFRITWEFGGGVSWVTVRLSAGGEATCFVLEHVAGADALPREFWETYGPGATGVGWDGGLLGLALHLGDTAGTLSPQDGATWPLTDEGRRFYRGAADGWAEAHIAGGGDTEVASRNADATFAFYTGVTA